MSEDLRIEALFRRLREGDLSARNELFPLVYEELRRLARGHMAHQRQSHTLQPTALANEAYLKLCRPEGAGWVDREHFLRLAATAMRQVLVDHARRRGAEKRREPGERVELDGLVAEFERRSGGLVELDAALERLARRNPDLVRVIELRFFGGHDMRDVAGLLGISERTAARRWETARLALLKELNA
jgi:RNA polymerase sigma factor (TIGR02999 family)